MSLLFPFEAPPARGQSIEVAPGVRWVRMPLPMKLDHINVWGIEDGEGWAIVDTGMRSEDTVNAWREVFAQAQEPGPITRVFVTHMHPDHIGMAGWLTRKFGCRLWMTRLEYLSCRVVVSDTGREAPPEGVEFCRRAGWGDAAIEAYRARFGNFGKHIHAIPDSYRRLHDGERIRIGEHDWQVIVGTGHSPEHACLYCAELKLLISGDQVLPRISSNISVYAMEPDADPMADWLASIDKLEQAVPDDVLVLPAHNECFRGLHERLARLREGQEQSLERLRRALAEPLRAVDTFSALFKRSITETDPGLLGLATGESIACLNYLLHRGEIARELHDDGAWWYCMR
jgi:glyoxylase-like metal-dependent hydrolase (beta-lactamase superfamily II)